MDSASIVAFFELAKRIFSQNAAVIAALVFFAIFDPLIYYASEVKQYSCDVLTSILLTLLFVRALDRKMGNGDFVVLAIAGAAALWFSHPAVFILSGAGTGLGVHFLLKRDRTTFLKYCGVVAIWVVSLAILYFVSLRQTAASGVLLAYWQANFMPLPPWRDWGWFLRAFRGVFSTFPVDAAMLLAAIGAVAILLRRWQVGLILILPVVSALAASALQKYPFSGRLLLFVVPAVLLLMAEPLGWISASLGRFKRLAFLGLPAALAVCVWVAAVPAYQAEAYVWHPRLREEIKPAMAHLSSEQQDKDIVYVYYGAGPAFSYYEEFFDLSKVQIVMGTSNRHHNEAYLTELDGLKGKGRVWFIFSHNYDWGGSNEQVVMTDHLDKIGTRLEGLRWNGAALYLYQL